MMRDRVLFDEYVESDFVTCYDQFGAFYHSFSLAAISRRIAMTPLFLNMKGISIYESICNRTRMILVLRTT